MLRIQTIPADQANGLLKELYADDVRANGYLPNHTQVFGLRPEVLAAYRKLMGTIRGNMSLRRYELVTLAAALTMRCVY